MSYLYRCGCAGTKPKCKVHGSPYIIESSCSIKQIEADSNHYKVGDVFLSKSMRKFDKTFDVAFLPSFPTPKDFEENPFSLPFKAHRRIKKFLNTKHQVILYCSYKDLAANLFSLECCKFKNITVCHSLRMLDDYDNHVTHQFRGAVIVAGTHDVDYLKSNCIYIGSSCLYEKHILKQSWVKEVLHYGATSPRVFLSALDTKKKITLHTQYQELFHLIAGGKRKIEYLRCEV